MFTIFAGPIDAELPMSMWPGLLSFLLASIILFQIIAYGIRKWVLKPKPSSANDKAYMANLTEFSKRTATLGKWIIFTFIALLMTTATTVIMNSFER